jgi:hypothetical protein
MRGSPRTLLSLVGAVALLVLAAATWDPPVQSVALHPGALTEPLNRGPHSGGNTPVQVRLTSGRLVVAQGVSELYGSPAGQPVLVQEFRSLVFRRASFVALPQRR